MCMRRLAKHLFPVASWQNPAIGLALRTRGPFDAMVRRTRGLRHRPEYSMRACSNRVARQFGGRQFEPTRPEHPTTNEEAQFLHSGRAQVGDIGPHPIPRRAPEGVYVRSKGTALFCRGAG